MKIVLLLIFAMVLFADKIELDSGWNLIGINSNIDLKTFKDRVGKDNLLVIQTVDKTYQKIYLDMNKSYLNDFKKFEDFKGAWVKVKNKVTVEYNSKRYFGKTTITLKKGWNLINPITNLTLEEIKKQVGDDNLLVVQGNKKTYKKVYEDQNLSFLNDFKHFEEPYGYWIKIAKNANLSFKSKPSIEAVDYKGNTIKYVTKDGLVVKILANNLPKIANSQDFIAVYGSINANSTKANLKLNSSYPDDTIFQIVIYDSANNIIYKSEYLNYDENLIKFKDIVVENSTKQDNTNIDETQIYRGIQVYKANMPMDKYSLVALTDSEFNTLSYENKLMVANKLLASLYFGMPYKELDTLIKNGNFISTIKKLILKKESNLEDVEKLIANKEVYKKACYCSMLSLAKLFHLSFGKDFIDRWSAYFLNQTILFSPAYELKTVSSQNICNVNAELVNGFLDHYSIRFLTFLHMISENNWRRFRSPEDNGREMLEIYLMDFNDSHVPIAAKALQNWHLEGNQNTLVIDSNRNNKPLNLFDTTIYNGMDFYSELVKYKDFIPAVTKRLVDIYFPNFSKKQRDEVVLAIVQSNPGTFEDILLQIVFSKKYLYYAKRYMSIEERFLSLSKKMSIEAQGYYYFVHVRKAFENMGQSSMEYKLGRPSSIPKDTYSVIRYKNFIQDIMLDPIRREGDFGWNPYVVIGGFNKDISSNLDEYIEYLFLYMVSRKPLDKERELLKNIIGNSTNRLNITNIILAYISRLSEFYRFDAIKE